VTVRFYIDPATKQPHIYGHDAVNTREAMNKQNRFPSGWNEARVQRVLAHYERQADTEAVAEDEAAYRSTRATVMKIPVRLVPAVRALLAKRRAS
jgi:hypothetical protein